MWSKHRWQAGAAVLAAILFTGCIRASGLEHFVDAIAAESPDVRLHKEVSLSLGSMSLGAVRFAVGLSGDDDAEEAGRYLAQVDRIQLVVYTLDSPLDRRQLRLPRELALELEDEGWELLVRANEPDDMAWIHYRADDKDRVRDLMILAVDNEDLVIVRLSGRLDQLFAEAMKDHHGLTSMARRAAK